MKFISAGWFSDTIRNKRLASRQKTLPSPPPILNTTTMDMRDAYRGESNR